MRQASKQKSVFITEEQGRTTEFTEQASCGASRRPASRSAKRMNPFSVSSIVLPCSSVIKTLDFLIIHDITAFYGIFIHTNRNSFRINFLAYIVYVSNPTTRTAQSSPRYPAMPGCPD
jgi:hypothetical protein